MTSVTPVLFQGEVLMISLKDCWFLLFLTYKMVILCDSNLYFMRELILVNMKYRALARWSCLDSGGSEDKSDPYIQK